LIEIFSSGFDFHVSTAIMIAIKMLNRIDQTLNFIFQLDPDRKKIAGF